MKQVGMKQVGRVTVDTEREGRTPGQVESLAWFRGHLCQGPGREGSRAGPVQGDVQVWWQEVVVQV